MKYLLKGMYIIAILLIIVTIIGSFMLVKASDNIFQIATAQIIHKTTSQINNDFQYYISKNFNVVPKDPKSNKNVVLITIDDGPSNQSIPMMNILEKHNAKAIFFINGMHNAGYPNIISEEAKAGFTIGNHTWSHIDLGKETDNTIINKEIDENSKLITQLTGSAPRFFRPPYGDSNAYVRDLIKKDGMIFMNWSGAAEDWEVSTKDKDVFINNVINNLHSGSVILIHEHLWSLEYLDDLLTAIEQKGYIFVSPDQIENQPDQTVNKQVTPKDLSCSQPQKEYEDQTYLNVSQTVNLPDTSYIPSDLEKLPSSISTKNICLKKEAVTALENMIGAADKEGYNIMVSSGFRDYNTQKSILENNLSVKNTDSSDSVAKPGFSEHQLGVAVDLTSKSINYDSASMKFENTDESKWLEAHSYEYGFIQSYPLDKENITGYMYEPWHYRYVGIENATEIIKTGETVNQFLTDKINSNI